MGIMFWVCIRCFYAISPALCIFCRSSLPYLWFNRADLQSSDVLRRPHKFAQSSTFFSSNYKWKIKSNFVALSENLQFWTIFFVKEAFYWEETISRNSFNGLFSDNFFWLTSHLYSITWNNIHSFVCWSFFLFQRRIF